jgi:quinoprotein glucose dehydrogenase
LVPVRTGLPWPIALAFSADGRVFFAERFTGRIQILGNATILDTTFFTIPEIASAGEQGLLGLAVDPNFPNAPYLYAYYTRDDATNGTVYNRLVRLRASGSVGIQLELLRDRIAASSIHNSGVIGFGPDGKLYVLVGDYTFGHRNMFGIAWNPTTHAGYVSENGPQDSDEINLLVPGGNYGWPNVRGIARTPPYLDPIIAYTPVIVPTNMAFDTAEAPASSRGHLVVGSFNDHRLHEIALTSDGTGVIAETFLATAADGILDVEMGLDGALWVTTPSGIYRLQTVPAATATQSVVDLRWIGISPAPLAASSVAGASTRAPGAARWRSDRSPVRPPRPSEH